MKVFKVVVQIIDLDGLGESGIREELENANFPNDCITLKVRDIQSRDIGPWRDDHPLNLRSTAQMEFDRLFA